MVWFNIILKVINLYSAIVIFLVDYLSNFEQNQSQGGDIYHHQAQSGITYYSMQSQQVMQMQRIQAQKRPKAAIPIVPPPELKEPRGRGRLHPQNEEHASSIGADTSNNPDTAYDGEHEGNFNSDVAVQQ